MILLPRRFILTFLCLAAAPGLATADVLFATDFGATPPAVTSYGSDTLVNGTVKANHAFPNLGTVDTYLGEAGPALVLTADFTRARRNSKAGITVGPFEIRNKERELAKLTFGFDVKVNKLRPVRVVIQSCTAAGRPTGTLAAMVYPPVVDAYYRFNVDLDKAREVMGKFDPVAPQVRFSFEITGDPEGAGGPAIPRSGGQTLAIDNLSYTSPSYYVSEAGSDRANGRSSDNAFKTIGKAVDVARSGDVVLVMDGTYLNGSATRLATFDKAGAPHRWIVLRGHPGHSPQLISNGWEVIKLIEGAAYIEIRDLTIRGRRAEVNLADATSDGLINTKDGQGYPGDPIYNTNGVNADGRQSPSPGLRPHHLRYIGNHVYDLPAAGLSAIYSDYVTVEGNHVHGNANFMRYGGSGISLLHMLNYSKETSHRSFVLNNKVHHNRTYVPWAAIGKISDGNGIIVDINLYKDKPADNFLGRVLVANNLSYGNGGAGINLTSAQRVDVVNNTLYHNVQSPELRKAGWGELFLGGAGSNDINVVNNIIATDGTHPAILYLRTKDISVMNNLWVGVVEKDLKRGDRRHEGNRFADSVWVNASVESEKADFHPLAGGPAIDAALGDVPGAPLRDLAGEVRATSGKSPDLGAFEYKAPR